jgi:hypothetical protein
MTKRKQAKIDQARIQRAVTGLILSMGSIPRIYAHAEKLIADGADDTALAKGIRIFLGEAA